MVSTIADYAATENLRNGRAIEIRALRHEDHDDFVAAAGRLSTQSLYRRFFAVKRNFTEKETSFFLDVDFVNHVALVAVAQNEGKPSIVGGGRYVVVKPGQAEVAFAVTDDYQGQGIGAALMRHLVAIGRGAGLREFIAEVLPSNTAMLKVFEKSGLHVKSSRQSGITYVTLGLTGDPASIQT
jgi:ribosomal protein S18 acetylase RimI-like enzyme